MKLRKDARISVGIVILAFIATMLALWLTDPHTTARRCAAGWILGALALGVPIWFLWEYASRSAEMKAGELDELKYGQELARNFWLAMMAVLAFMFGLIEWPGLP
jgi:hypothetical protein